jgi:hypothetical protein
VREACDFILQAQGKFDTAMAPYLQWPNFNNYATKPLKTKFLPAKLSPMPDSPN